MVLCGFGLRFYHVVVYAFFLQSCFTFNFCLCFYRECIKKTTQNHPLHLCKGVLVSCNTQNVTSPLFSSVVETEHVGSSRAEDQGEYAIFSCFTIVRCLCHWDACFLQSGFNFNFHYGFYGVPFSDDLRYTSHYPQTNTITFIL